MFVHGGNGGKRKGGWVGVGEREKWGGELSDISSHKYTNPIGTGPHPYDLI